MAAKKRSASARRPGARSARSAQSPPILRAMVVDALKGWVVPVGSGLGAGTTWLLWMFGAIDESRAAVGVAAGLLLLVLFASFKTYFFDDARAERFSSIALAIVWGVIAFLVFYQHDFPGSVLQSGVLRPNADALTLPAERRYAIVVDGHFTAGERQGTRVGQYALELVPAGGSARRLTGSFQDHWTQQRLGRRGSAPVEVQRTSARHEVDLGAPASSSLRLLEVDSSLRPELEVLVYAGTNPWIFPALGVLGILGTLALEKVWDGDGTGTMAVGATACVLYFYLGTPPHQQVRSLIGAILLGGILGAPLAVVLWRLVPRRWIVRRA